MPKKTYFCEENIEDCKSRLLQILEDLATGDNFTSLIVVDENIVSDCFRHAENTVKFYGLGDGNVSHYKEISHISYWLSKLKPISLESPQKLTDRLVRYGLLQLKTLAGDSPLKIQQSSEDADFAINEYLAFNFATISIRACQLAEINELEANEQKSLYEELMVVASGRVDSMQKAVLHSMRYHNYSARGFATTIEGMLRLGEI